MAQRTIGQGVGFERTRRITGYLSAIPRFCDSKLAELKDRVLHVSPSVVRRVWIKHDWVKDEEAA